MVSAIIFTIIVVILIFLLTFVISYTNYVQTWGGNENVLGGIFSKSLNCLSYVSCKTSKGDLVSYCICWKDILGNVKCTGLVPPQCR